MSYDLGHVLVVFWLGGAPKSPCGVPNSPKWTTLCSMQSRDTQLFYGMIQLWENWVIVAWKAEKGISDNLRHVLVVFWLIGALNGPQASFMVPNGRPWVPWEVEIQNCTVALFNYEKLGVSPMEGGQGYSWWFKACFGHFWLKGPPKGSHRVLNSPKRMT